MTGQPADPGPPSSLSDEVRGLHKAVEAEARRGYGDLQGKRERFSVHVAGRLRRVAHEAPGEVGRAAGRLAEAFEGYARLDPPDREALASGLLRLLPRLVQVAGRLDRASTPGVRSGRPPAAPPPAADGDWRDREVQYVKGVGPRLAETLGRVGIRTVEDLLAYYPTRVLDCGTLKPIRELTAEVRDGHLAPGAGVATLAVVSRVEAYVPPNRPSMTIVALHLKDETGTAQARWFYGKLSHARREQLKGRFLPNTRVLVSGKAKVDDFSRKLVFDRPDVEPLALEVDEDTGKVVPLYPLTEGLHNKVLRKALGEALKAFGPNLGDPLPPAVREGLLARPEALQQIHFPRSRAEYDQARDRLVFEELFWMQLGLAYRREQLARREQAVALPATGELVDRLRAALPFRLTRAQERVFDEIRRDLAGSKPMNRLVQGDVGSGKTVVALLSLLVAVENGYQGALMAPTEILAEQHAAKIREWLAPLGVPSVPVLGKQSRKEREQALSALASGYARIAVGTHALIQDTVRFERLGLVVIDEQHRFGVGQRAQLRAKGLHPQVLTMTATPIPRTLALTLHGDLDVSAIDELPPGRKPIRTRWLTGTADGSRGRQSALTLVREEVLRGHQAYVVLPLVNESEELEGVRAATAEYEQLAREDLPHLRLGLLHGQMRPDEKDAVVEAFRRHELDVLVSTTVIEVGVDVPNATVMVVLHAERFGLAQLHQLRGRVGRGGDQAHCLLVTADRGEAARARMEVMEATQDGFVIAQKDLELRGPGEFLGTRQSGLPDLLLADLVKDTAILETARTRALEVVHADPELARHPTLRDGLRRHFRKDLGFLGIG